MALMRSGNIPKDAVILNESDAAEYIWNTINNWPKLSEVWALQYSAGILGGVSALSGAIVNSHYRNKMRLATYGYFSSVLPMTLVPGLMSAMYHRYSVTTNMLMLKQDTCPICIELRSAAVQMALGVAYPMILGPVTSMMLASRYNTIRIPLLNEGPKVLYQFISKCTKPFKLTLLNITIAQLVFSSVLTYFEMRNNIAMRTKLIEVEQKLQTEGILN